MAPPTPTLSSLPKEVVSMICWSTMENQHFNDISKELLSLALACRSTSEPALDVIWNTLISIWPLLLLLPEDLRVFRRIEESEDRKLDFMTRLLDISQDELVSALESLHRAGWHISIVLWLRRPAKPVFLSADNIGCAVHFADAVLLNFRYSPESLLRMTSLAGSSIPPAFTIYGIWLRSASGGWIANSFHPVFSTCCRRSARSRSSRTSAHSPAARRISPWATLSSFRPASISRALFTL